MGIKVSLESLQPQSLDVASHKLQELHQSLRDLELKMSQVAGGGLAPVQGACAPTLATSFTPLPSTFGAALELQLQSEKTKVAELNRRCQELELKVSTFENIVCVLNREMEHSCTTMEAYNRQHRLDQDKIEILSNKVTNVTWPVQSSCVFHEIRLQSKWSWREMRISRHQKFQENFKGLSFCITSHKMFWKEKINSWICLWKHLV